MPARARGDAQTERLAYEAARIMIDLGIADYERARRKAAARIGAVNRRFWPDNAAIQAALVAQRRIFSGPCENSANDQALMTILEAMRTFAAFAPRLISPRPDAVGLVALHDGHDAIELLLFADQPEDVLLGLLERRIPHEDGERLFHYRGGERRRHPRFRFIAGDAAIALSVLPRRERGCLPLDPITSQPFQGATLREVERLVERDNVP